MRGDLADDLHLSQLAEVEVPLALELRADRVSTRDRVRETAHNRNSCQHIGMPPTFSTVNLREVSSSCRRLFSSLAAAVAEAEDGRPAAGGAVLDTSRAGTRAAATGFGLAAAAATGAFAGFSLAVAAAAPPLRSTASYGCPP